ncbi:MAG TPA: asparaginase domain-containing protein, partial [Cryomorphaceae bacterium]|nr:asparaginase domain-containing protein [Cryomorphaceae bacterium]
PEIKNLSAAIHTESFDEPLDSSNMGLEHWQKLAYMIYDNYDRYDGFVILHGSDTMAYTASALSFMFVNLSKPVILTGSQLPIGMVRTDGKENLITAIEIACDYHQDVPMVPEVAIYFEYHLYRGNRTFKYNTEHFEAFESPNYPFLAEAGVTIKYNSQFINKASELPFRIEPKLDNRVAVLTLFPGVSQHIVEAALTIKDNLVLVVRTYGSGNAMTYPWFLEALQRASDRGLILINATHCRGGGVKQGKYETSGELERIGLISAGDMQLEAVVAKSMYLLGQGLSKEEFSLYFQEDLRGERTAPQLNSTD